MKEASATILFVILTQILFAQNLVPNSSFEKKRYCPTTFNQQQLTYLEDWYQPTGGTPDYFHECSGKVGVPENMFGEQPARDGEGYAGLVTFTSSKRDYREYLQVKLDRSLGSGELVCVELQVSSADKAWFLTDGFGVHFSQTKIQSHEQKRLMQTEHFGNPRLHILDEMETWVKMSDVFRAQGGEQYLTIGNFRPDHDLYIIRRTDEPGADASSDWAYLYVDSVVVRPVQTREECSCVNDIIASTVHDPPLELQEFMELELNTILFDFDESYLNDLAIAELERVLLLLDRNSATYIEVIGHTDIVGSEAYNIGLSRRRANAVVDYLEYKGVDPARLTITWVGSNDPIADNESSEGRAQNRRVEFKVLQKRYQRYEASTP